MRKSVRGVRPARRGIPASVLSAIGRGVPFSVISANWPLLLGMGVLMLGAGLQSTLLGLRATLEGFPPLVTGLIMSCYYVGYVLGTVVAPPLLRQVGHIRVFATLAAIASVAILVQGCFVNPVTWGAMRLMSGLCFAGIYVVAESWLHDRASRANRGGLFAVYMLILYVGLKAVGSGLSNGNLNKLQVSDSLEHRAGIEPANAGFADLE